MWGRGGVQINIWGGGIRLEKNPKINKRVGTFFWHTSVSNKDARITYCISAKLAINPVVLMSVCPRDCYSGN